MRWCRRSLKKRVNLENDEILNEEQNLSKKEQEKEQVSLNP